MAKRAASDVQTLESELSRIGLLMQHDARLPSATALIAGEAIQGSWWGHAQGGRIYGVLTEFERGAGRLSVKLVNAKLTYVDSSLWPAFLRLALLDRQTTSLSPAATELGNVVRECGQVRLQELEHINKRELTAAARELEEHLLVHSDSEHTSSGHHQKVLSSWSEWSRRSGAKPAHAAPDHARAELERAVGRLTEGSVRGVRVPFLSG